MLHSVRYLDDIGPQQSFGYNLGRLGFPSSGRDRSRGFGFNVVVEESDSSREVFVCYNEGSKGKKSGSCAKMRQETWLTVIVEHSGGICFPDLNDIRVYNL